MKNLPKTLFFDFDGTLVDPTTHVIPESALKAINQVIENGYRVAIASGRNYPLIKITGVLEMAPWAGLILNNGQIIMDEKHTELKHSFIEAKAIRQIIKTARSLGSNLFFSCPDGDFMDREADDLMRRAHAFFDEPIPEIGIYTHQRVDKILVYHPKGFDYSIYQAIEGVDVFPSVSTYADIATQGVSKAASIETFCDLMGIEHDYAAFGDSLNDYDMIQHARIGVAMGNGEQALKDIADVIAPDVHDDGIAKVLKQLGYIY